MKKLHLLPILLNWGHGVGLCKPGLKGSGIRVISSILQGIWIKAFSSCPCSVCKLYTYIEFINVD